VTNNRDFYKNTLSSSKRIDKRKQLASSSSILQHFLFIFLHYCTFSQRIVVLLDNNAIARVGEISLWAGQRSSSRMQALFEL
jgi:hypothetical protein